MKFQMLRHLCSFVDHDMAMQFWGGGVGHKSTQVAIDLFLTDQNHLDCQVSMGDASEDKDNEDGHSNGKGQPAVDTNNHDKMMDKDGDENEEDDWEDLRCASGASGEEDNEDEEDLTYDALGPDDGEVDNDDMAGLSFVVF